MLITSMIEYCFHYCFLWIIMSPEIQQLHTVIFGNSIDDFVPFTLTIALERKSFGFTYGLGNVTSI